MSDKKISQLPASTTPLAGTEELALVQSGNTKKVSVANLTAGRSVSASSVTATSAEFGSNALNIDPTNNRVVIGKSVPGIKKLDMQVAANDGIRLYRPGATVAHVIAVDGSNGLKIEMEGVGNSITIDNSRNIGVTAGNLVIGTSGNGINFSADSHAAGMTSELLDDYEEGTWTPTQGAGLTVVGSFNSSGAYTKIGRMVTLRGEITGSTSVAVAANSVLCGGLPFTAAAAYSTGSAVNLAMTISGTILSSSSTIYSTAIAATPAIDFTITYFV